MSKEGIFVPRIVVVSALAIGIAAGSYGIASAASGSSSSSSNGNATYIPVANVAAPNAQNPWGGQRTDETLLTGDTKSKVEQLAKAKVPNGTVVRVETDADGNAAYEAHMTKQDGTPVTVYVDKQFNVVSVESR
jgi:hypothetical protein